MEGLKSVAGVSAEIAKPEAVTLKRNSPISGGEPADFSALVTQMLTDVSQSVKSAEVAAAAGIRGEVPLTEVVDKVLEAERTLQSAVAVRDKVVAAYLELSRMQI